MTIKNATSYKELATNYDISHPLMQRRIKELLSPFGVGRYIDVKQFLENISINNILDELRNIGIIDKLVALGYFKE